MTTRKKLSKAFKDLNHLCFFVSRKSEQALVDEFTDIVAINDAKKKVVFFEVKRQLKNYNEQTFLKKVAYALSKLRLQGYSVEQKCVSLDHLQMFLDEYKPHLL